MLCKKRRIKPTQKRTSMGMTTIEHISEGMCRQCAWERIKHKCKICNKVIGKGYPRLLAHITSHYTSNELLYKEDIETDIISINFESSNTLPNEWVVDKEEEKGQYLLKCKICKDTFMFKKEGTTMFSKWIDHIKSHYLDKDLVNKGWIAKNIVHLNYDSVLLLLTSSNHRNGNKANSSIDNNYRDLTKREINAYRNALRRIRNEESITKSKGR
jgi:hypothetical protein